MNLAAKTLPPRRLLSLAEEAANAVHVGLLDFIRGRGIENVICEQLQAHLQSRLSGSTVPSWQETKTLLQQRLHSESPSTPLGRLINEYQLTTEQLFVLTLIGEVEVSHAVALAVATLQAPGKNPRPQVHFLIRLINHLFLDAELEWRTFDICQQPLVSDGIVSLAGEGPLNCQTLAMSPHLYAVLQNHRFYWPGCTEIQLDDSVLTQASRNQLQGLEKIVWREESKPPVSIIIRGHPNSGRREFASALGQRRQCKVIAVPWEQWRHSPDLAAALRYSGCLAVLQPEIAPGETLSLPDYKTSPPLCIILGESGAIAAQNITEVFLSLPTTPERCQRWRQILPEDHGVDSLAASALLSLKTIDRIAATIQQNKLYQQSCTKAEKIMAARRQLSAEKLLLLAQPVERRVEKTALVMPPLVEKDLQSVIKRASKRDDLWEHLGLTLQATPNPGVRALFVGESGTGKTLAASYIATQLAAPLYRVDLANVMNKYIGESEKNLSQLLDYAAASDVVLLFDEADALFGKRSDGKETGERFANMLTNFLLTRIETHPGIVILTTNSRERIDSAFSRRIDTVVEFPLPGFEERLALWHSHLGEKGPGADCYRTLASYCDFAGGQIRNAVVSAAVFADGASIGVAELIAGLRLEYQKLGRDLPGKISRLSAAG